MRSWAQPEEGVIEEIKDVCKSLTNSIVQCGFFFSGNNKFLQEWHLIGRDSAKHNSIILLEPESFTHFLYLSNVAIDTVGT